MTLKLQLRAIVLVALVVLGAREGRGAGTQFSVPSSTGHSNLPRTQPSSNMLSFPSPTSADDASVLCVGMVHDGTTPMMKEGVVLSTDGGQTWKDADADITAVGTSGYQAHVRTAGSSSNSVHGSIFGIDDGYVKPWNNTKDMVGPWQARQRYTYTRDPTTRNVRVVKDTATATATTTWGPLPHKAALHTWVSGGVAHLGGSEYIATPWVWYNNEPFYTKDGKMNLTCCNGSVAVYRSSDGGDNWNYAGEIASKQSLNAAGFKSEEGPNENDVVLLKDGRTVLCIFRRDGGDGKLHHDHVPYVFATTTIGREGNGSNGTANKGGGREGASDTVAQFSLQPPPPSPPLSWKLTNAPSTMLSARPRALVLENGALIVAGGRPALNMWVSATGDVEGPWETIDIPHVHNTKVSDPTNRFCPAFENATTALGWYQSSCYNELVALSPNTGLVCYEKQGATSGGGNPVPPECAFAGSTIYCMQFTVTPAV